MTILRELRIIATKIMATAIAFWPGNKIGFIMLVIGKEPMR